MSNTNDFRVGDRVLILENLYDDLGMGKYLCATKGEVLIVKKVENAYVIISHEHRVDFSFTAYPNEIQRVWKEYL